MQSARTTQKRGLGIPRRPPSRDVWNHHDTEATIFHSEKQGSNALRDFLVFILSNRQGHILIMNRCWYADLDTYRTP